MEEYYDLEGKLTVLSFKKAFKMESKKQQKYDEMVAMLESILKISSEGYDLWETELDACIKKAEQLIKEAKEL
jgi:hypothetical protein